MCFICFVDYCIPPCFAALVLFELRILLILLNLVGKVWVVVWEMFSLVSVSPYSDGCAPELMNSPPYLALVWHRPDYA